MGLVAGSFQPFLETALWPLAVKLGHTPKPPDHVAEKRYYSG